jgi:hypothetical protein
MPLSTIWNASDMRISKIIHRDLHSKYLFKSREEAQRYRETHVDHVSTRILKRGVTGGPYVYSLHDLGWVDFLRIGHSIDVDTLKYC